VEANESADNREMEATDAVDTYKKSSTDLETMEEAMKISCVTGNKGWPHSAYKDGRYISIRAQRWSDSMEWNAIRTTLPSAVGGLSSVDVPGVPEGLPCSNMSSTANKNGSVALSYTPARAFSTATLTTAAETAVDVAKMNSNLIYTLRLGSEFKRIYVQHWNFPVTRGVARAVDASDGSHLSFLTILDACTLVKTEYYTKEVNDGIRALITTGDKRDDKMKLKNLRTKYSRRAEHISVDILVLAVRHVAKNVQDRYREAH